MNVELVHTDFFDSDAIRLPDYKVGRISYGSSGRSYVKLVDGMIHEPFRLYTSLTTAINQCAPMAPQLLEWYCKLGLSEAYRQLELSQHYGSLMHLLLGKYLMENRIDLDLIPTLTEEYLSKYSYWQPECKDWPNKLKFDVLAFVNFANEYAIHPLGIEYVLLSERYGFGTLIDLVCMMDVPEKGYWGEQYKSGDKKGQPKETKRITRKRVIMNFKSGRHGFYPSNGIQAVAEKLLWEENFPDLPLDGCYNWSPKEWESSPSYNLKDWNGLVDLEEIEAIMSLAELRFGIKSLNKTYISLSGVAFKGHDVNECIKIIGVEQYAKQKFTDLLV